MSGFFGSLLARAAGLERGLAPRPRYRFSPAPSRPPMHRESALTAVETATSAPVARDEVTRTGASRGREISAERDAVVDRRDRPGSSPDRETGLWKESQDSAQLMAPDRESSARAQRVDTDGSVAAPHKQGGSAPATGQRDSGLMRDDGDALRSFPPERPEPPEPLRTDPSPLTLTRTPGAREKSRRAGMESVDPRPAVTIHIGRVEVAAVSVPAAPAKPTQQKTVLRKPSLDQYLERRERRKL